MDLDAADTDKLHLVVNSTDLIQDEEEDLPSCSYHGYSIPGNQSPPRPDSPTELDSTASICRPTDNYLEKKSPIRFRQKLNLAYSCPDIPARFLIDSAININRTLSLPADLHLNCDPCSSLPNTNDVPEENKLDHNVCSYVKFSQVLVCSSSENEVKLIPETGIIVHPKESNTILNAPDSLKSNIDSDETVHNNMDQVEESTRPVGYCESFNSGTDSNIGTLPITTNEEALGSNYASHLPDDTELVSEIQQVNSDPHVGHSIDPESQSVDETAQILCANDPDLDIRDMTSTYISEYNIDLEPRSEIVGDRPTAQIQCANVLDTESEFQSVTAENLNVNDLDLEPEIQHVTAENEAINDLDLEPTTGSQKRRKGRKRYRRKLSQKNNNMIKPKNLIKPAVYTDLISVCDDSYDGLTCCICLDVYYQPHLVVPCGHTFCEPCLRRLAKYNSVSGCDTLCPVCRVTIRECAKHENLCLQVQYFLPEEFATRHRQEKHSKYMSHPLPSKRPRPLLDLRTLARLVQRRRQRPALGREPANISFCRYLVLILFFLVLKAVIACVVFGVTALFYGNVSVLHDGAKVVSKYVINYRSLSDKDKASLANITAVIIGIIVLLYFVIKKIEEKYNTINRR